MANEAAIEASIVSWAEGAGWLSRKVQWIGRRGAPDRVFARRGTVLFFEIKDPDGDLSLVQCKETWRMAQAGIHVFVLDSSEEAIDVLRSFA